MPFPINIYTVPRIFICGYHASRTPLYLYITNQFPVISNINMATVTTVLTFCVIKTSEKYAPPNRAIARNLMAIADELLELGMLFCERIT